MPIDGGRPDKKPLPEKNASPPAGLQSQTPHQKTIYHLKSIPINSSGQMPGQIGLQILAIRPEQVHVGDLHLAAISGLEVPFVVA